MFNKKEEKVSSKKINDVLTLTKKILKIVYVFMILAGIYAIIMICEKLHVMGFIISLIKLLSPLFIGIVLAWLLEPSVHFLQKKGINRVLGSIIVYAILIAIIYVILWTLVPIIIEQINDLVASMPKLITSIQKWLNHLLDNDIFKFINKQELFASISEIGTSLSTDLPTNAVDMVKTVFSSLGTFAFGLIIGFYLLFNFNNVSTALGSFVPRKFKNDVKGITSSMNSSVRSYVIGVFILASLIFIVCSIGFSIVGIKAPVLFGFICGITDLIPYIGPWIGGSIAVVVGFSSGVDTGLFTLLVVFVAQMLESYVLQPLIMSKVTKLHPVTIIVGLLVFEHFFGIVGMIFATPVIACLKIIYTYFDNKFHFFAFLGNSDEEIEEVKIGEEE